VSPFLHGVPSERVPPLHGSYETLRLLAVPPASLRFLRSAVPPERPEFAPWDEGRIIPGLGLGKRSPDRDSSAETARSPQVPGEPQGAHALVWDPGGSQRLAIRTPRYCLPRRLWRRLRDVPPFGVESHGLCTPCLRFVPTGHPVATQDSVPVSGHLFPGRDGYLLGSEARFQALTWCYPPSPGLSWRKAGGGWARGRRGRACPNVGQLITLTSVKRRA
jgi:hypothetical protein